MLLPLHCLPALTVLPQATIFLMFSEETYLQSYLLFKYIFSSEIYLQRMFLFGEFSSETYSLQKYLKRNILSRASARPP
jgi:hypothetical protein